MSTGPKYLHPNLQAELQFGKEQSNGAKFDDFIDNIGLFLEQGDEWKDANSDIVNLRNSATRQEFPQIDLLQSSVGLELQYQRHIWNGDFGQAIESAENVLSAINGPSELRGFRAWWHYLAGSASDLASMELPLYQNRATEHYLLARKAAPTLQWLIPLSLNPNDSQNSGMASAEDLAQIAHIEQTLTSLGAKNHRKFEEHSKEVRRLLLSNDANEFEAGLCQLGDLLGFETDNSSEDGAPDGWWVADDICIVFEAHSDGKPDTILGSRKARQSASHPTWLKENGLVDKSALFTSVLISPSRSIKKEAHGLLDEACYMELEHFRTWASKAIVAIRAIRNTYNQPGDLVWQSDALTSLSKHRLLSSEIVANFNGRKAKDMLDPAT